MTVYWQWEKKKEKEKVLEEHFYGEEWKEKCFLHGAGGTQEKA